jgi:glycosyltransferase involved in cell wall biosynthesis
MKISLITISCNNPKELFATIQSVKKNYYKKLEYIIVLGSKDKESLDILKKNQYYISKAIIEPDKGIYDALNKGVKNSSGNIICFVHSGDKLKTNYFSTIIKNIKHHDYVYGNINLITKKNNKLLLKSKRIDRLNNNILDIPILHPGLVVKKKIFNQIGYFKNKFIISDKLWMLKLIKSNFSGKKIDNVLVDFKMNGSSAKFSIIKEYYSVSRKYNLNILVIFFILIKLFLIIFYYKLIYYAK